MRSALKIINVIHIILALIFFVGFLGLLIVSLIGNGPIVDGVWDIFRPTKSTDAGIVPNFAQWFPIARFRETINVGTQQNPIWVFESPEIWAKCDANVERLIFGLRIQFGVFCAFNFFLGWGSYLCLKKMEVATRKTQFTIPVICMFLAFNWVLAIMILCCKRSTLINQHPYFE